ncbi:MAG: response regulator transcription factor [Clostridia bacterium]|jgi:two-component system response regulator RegX3|nr:response regulator transcription factor [Clostridia bacterium]
MDINLANKSGYDICRRIRENDKSQHIIFISAKEREEDIIMGYSVGADDYIVKPFQMNILLMKVINILNKGKEKSKKKFREYDIDEGGMRLVSEEKVIEMKNLEFKLFMYLYENRGKVVDKYEIINNV